MSRRNKVNPDHYTIAGRLAPDDWARERRKQAEQMFGSTRGGRRDKPMPPWMANGQGGDSAGNGRSNGDVGPGGSDRRDEGSRSERPKQDTDMGTTRGAASGEAQPRSTPKASGARGTPKSGKSPQARGTAARGASPQRAQKPAARKTASRGTQKKTDKKGSSPARAAKKGTARSAATQRAGANKAGAKKSAAKKSGAKAKKKGAAKKR